MTTRSLITVAGRVAGIAGPVCLAWSSASVLAATPANESGDVAAVVDDEVADLAEGVTSDDGTLVARIREFVLRESAERTGGEMREYKGVIPKTGVAYEMVPIPGGTFTMGSPADEPHRREDEGPRREISIEPFWMGRFEVTWNQFEPFMMTTEPRNRDGSPRSLPVAARLRDFVSSPTNPYLEMDFGMGKDGFPAICMTHHAASKFCQWLSAQTGHFYRLPTEAEWEYACRAGTTTAYHFGDDPADLPDYAWFWHQDGPGQYAKVGLKKPNSWGLFDMHGNVSEWCLDQYFADAYGAGRETVPARMLYPRVFRGGSWDDEPEDLRSARRFASSEDLKRQDPELPKSIWHHTDALGLGFRLVRPLAIPSAEEMDRLWNGGDVSENGEWNARIREDRRKPIPRKD